MSELPRGLNGKGLVNRYDRLGAEERFRLAIEASARDDDRELERLASSCPMRTYDISDPAYMDRVAASREIALALALHLLPLAATLLTARAVREAFAHRIAAAVSEEIHDEFGGEQAKAIAIAHEATADRFAAEDAELRSRGAASVEAFRQVCQEMGLEPEVVLRAHLGPVVDQLELAEWDGVTPDREARARWGEVFARRWGTRVGP